MQCRSLPTIMLKLLTAYFYTFRTKGKMQSGK